MNPLEREFGSEEARIIREINEDIKIFFRIGSLYLARGTKYLLGYNRRYLSIGFGKRELVGIYSGAD